MAVVAPQGAKRCPMTTKKPTAPAYTGLDLEGHAPTVVLPGTATPRLSETPELVAERYEKALQVKRLERRLAEIDVVLKKRTGERQVGDFMVNVSSFTTERLDAEDVKEILGDGTPYKASVSVRLSVVPA